MFTRLNKEPTPEPKSPPQNNEFTPDPDTPPSETEPERPVPKKRVQEPLSYFEELKKHYIGPNIVFCPYNTFALRNYEYRRDPIDVAIAENNRRPHIRRPVRPYRFGAYDDDKELRSQFWEDWVRMLYDPLDLEFDEPDVFDDVEGEGFDDQRRPVPEFVETEEKKEKKVPEKTPEEVAEELELKLKFDAVEDLMEYNNRLEYYGQQPIDEEMEDDSLPVKYVLVDDDGPEKKKRKTLLEDDEKNDVATFKRAMRATTLPLSDEQKKTINLMARSKRLKVLRSLERGLEDDAVITEQRLNALFEYETSFWKRSKDGQPLGAFNPRITPETIIEDTEWFEEAEIPEFGEEHSNDHICGAPILVETLKPFEECDVWEWNRTWEAYEVRAMLAEVEKHRGPIPSFQISVM